MYVVWSEKIVQVAPTEAVSSFILSIWFDAELPWRWDIDETVLKDAQAWLLQFCGNKTVGDVG